MAGEGHCRQLQVPAQAGAGYPLEALKLYRQGEGVNVDKPLHYARVCQVERVMRPYLEALLWLET